MKTEKKRIKKELERCSVDSIVYNYPENITLETLNQKFKDHIDKMLRIYADENFDEVTMDFENEYGYYDSCTYMVVFYGERWETDKELEKRIETAKKISKAKIEAAKITATKKAEEELSLFQKLKKKFEG